MKLFHHSGKASQIYPELYQRILKFNQMLVDADNNHSHAHLKRKNKIEKTFSHNHPHAIANVIIEVAKALDKNNLTIQGVSLLDFTTQQSAFGENHHSHKINLVRADILTKLYEPEFLKHKKR